MNQKIITRYAVRESMGLICMGAALFWSAGTLNWWPVWACLAVTLAWVIGTATVILRFNPDLLAERLGPRKGAKSWDTVIMSLLGVFQLARYIIAGLDHRYAWSSGFPFAVQLIALLGCILGYGLFVWATASNAFFSQIVRIQTEREHTVVSGGPYHYVRHPAYIGAILFEIAVSVLFASWWALAIGALDVILLIVRTALEDRSLKAELPGYKEYVQQVRARLIPGIW